MNRKTGRCYRDTLLVASVACALAPGCRSGPRPSSDVLPTRVARIEHGLLPPVRVKGRAYTPASIEDRMRAHGVPGVSIAVINDGRVEWARAYGMADVEAGRRATTATLFQAASMSKPVAAMGALRLVQEGRLSLDEDVNGPLRSWKVPGNELTARRPVTLREILTHSAGLTVHGFPGYAADAPVPSVVQVLNGEKPANTAAVRVDVEPGSQWRYSGGGMTVMQLLMSDITGEHFPALMRRLVLNPVGMASSTYDQPLPAALAVRAATGYRSRARAVEGHYHTYPEMAAAGLWTTPTDLAAWIIDVQRSLAGTSNRVLSREMTTAMLTRGVGGWGLGVSLEGAGDSLRFGHGGANEGFRGVFVGFAARGQGAVVMTNVDGGMALADEVLHAVAKEYGWPAYAPREIVARDMTLETMGQYAGRYAMRGNPFELAVAIEDRRLMVTQPGGSAVEIVPTDTDVFTALAAVPPVRFERDSAGRIVALVVGGTRLERLP